MTNKFHLIFECFFLYGARRLDHIPPFFFFFLLADVFSDKSHDYFQYSRDI